MNATRLLIVDPADLRSDEQLHIQDAIAPILISTHVEGLAPKKLSSYPELDLSQTGLFGDKSRRVPNTLNFAETELIRAILVGKDVELSAPDNVLTAENLRILLLRLVSPHVAPAFYMASCPRWVIRGAVIDKRLDLRDGSLAGGLPLPALEFANCDFADGIDAGEAHFERLELNGCRFHGKPQVTSEPRAAAADNSQQQNAIGQRDRAQSTKFGLTAPINAAAAPSDITEPAQQTQDGAEQDELPEKSAEPETTPENDVDMSAANQDTKGLPQCVEMNTPIVLHNARINTELCIKNLKPEEDGLLWLYAEGLRAGSGVRIQNSAFKAPKGEKVVGDGSARFALDFSNAVIDGKFFAQPDVKAEGGIRLRSATVEGDFLAQGIQASDGEDENTRAAITNDVRRYAISLIEATIKGSVMLDAFALPNGNYIQTIIRGNVSCFGVTVSGGVYLNGICVRPVRKGQGIEQPGLNCHNAAIDGDFVMQAVNLPVSRLHPEIAGEVDLSGVQVKKTLAIDGALLSLDLQGAAVGAQLLLKGRCKNIQATSLQVGGRAILSTTVLGFAAVKNRYIGYLEELGLFQEAAFTKQWAKEFRLFMTLATECSVDLRYSTFSSTLDLSGLSFQKDAKPELSLKGVRVEKTLRLAIDQPRFIEAVECPLICWPDCSLIQMQLEMRPSLSEESNRWEGSRKAYTTFLYDKGRKRSALQMGEPIYPYAGGRDALTEPLTAQQEIAASAIERFPLQTDEAKIDYVRLLCVNGFDAENDALNVAEIEEHLPASLRSCEFTFIPEESFKGMKQLLPEDFSKWIVSSSVQEIKRWQIPFAFDDPEKNFVWDGFVFYLRGGEKIDVLGLEVDEAGRLSKPIIFGKLTGGKLHEERHWEPPFRFGSDAERPDYSPLATPRKGKPLNQSEFESLIPDWRTQLIERDRLRGVRVDLRDLHCGTLEDAGGTVWLSVIQGVTNYSVGNLLTENMTYTRLASPGLPANVAEKADVETRKRMLGLTFSWEFLDLKAYSEIAAEYLADQKEQGHIQVATSDEIRRAWLPPNPEDKRSRNKHVKDYPYKQLAKIVSLIPAEWGERTKGEHEILRLGENSGAVCEPFAPQPYQQLAKVLRDQGDEYAAREIEREKMDLEMRQRAADYRQKGRWARSEGLEFWRFAYGLCFGFGLELTNTLWTLIVFYFLGTIAIWSLNSMNLLVTTTTAVTSVVAESGPDKDKLIVPKTATEKDVSEIPCGEAINPLLYAVETFTPLINLHQTVRCDVPAPGPTHLTYLPVRISNYLPSWSRTRGRMPSPLPKWARYLSISPPRLFELLKAIYEALGYVIWSLALLTFSGVARRWDQT